MYTQCYSRNLTKTLKCFNVNIIENVFRSPFNIILDARFGGLRSCLKCEKDVHTYFHSYNLSKWE